MRDNLTSKKIYFIVNILYTGISIAVAFVLIKYIVPIIFPFILAGLLSMIIEPVIKTLTSKLKLCRSISVLFSMIFFVLITISVLVALSVFVFDELKNIYDVIPLYKEKLSSYINTLMSQGDKSLIKSFLINVINYVKNLDVKALLGGSFGSSLVSGVSSIVISIPKIMISTAITLVATFFISTSLPEIKSFIIKRFGNKNLSIIINVKHATEIVFKKYLKSYLILMLVTFAELTVLFVLFKIRPAASLALLISFVDILPVLGVGIILIPWSLVSIITGNLPLGIVLIAIYIIVAIVRQIIEPKIIGDNIGLPPIVTLILLYVSLKLFGVFGALIIPLIVIILFDLQREGYLRIIK